jgi:hypothetical protein
VFVAGAIATESDDITTATGNFHFELDGLPVPGPGAVALGMIGLIMVGVTERQGA